MIEEEIGTNSGTGAPMGLPSEWLSTLPSPTAPKKKIEQTQSTFPLRKGDHSNHGYLVAITEKADKTEKSEKSEKLPEKKRKKHLLKEVEELHQQLEDMKEKLKSKNSALETLQSKWCRDTGTDPMSDDQVRPIQAYAACANASTGRIENLKIMLQHGADIHLPTVDGRTALHCAASVGYTAVVMFLLDSGAPLDVKDNSGRTPFDEALRTAHYQILQVLDEAKAVRQFKNIEKEYKLADYLPVGNEDHGKHRHETVQLQRQISKLSRFFGEGEKERSKKGADPAAKAGTEPATTHSSSFIPKTIASSHSGKRDAITQSLPSRSHNNASDSASLNVPPPILRGHSSTAHAPGSPSLIGTSTGSSSSLSVTHIPVPPAPPITSKQRKKDQRKSVKGLKRWIDVWRGHSHTVAPTGAQSTSSISLAKPYGIAFGRLRGACQANDCLCQSFHRDHSVAGAVICTCKHFPATHLDLGEAEILESDLLAGLEHLHIEDESSQELLIEKDPGTPWPKILNPMLQNDNVAQLFSTVITHSDAIIDAKDLEFTKKLGQGASATVYRGICKGKTVAIKIIDFFPTPKRPIEKIQYEMTEELRIMNSLSEISPNVVHFYGVVTQPRLCILLEYCSQGSLTDVLQNPKLQMDWNLFFKWVKQIVHGVHDLHSWDPPIVHRDLKSLNLLVDANGHVKVADFGLSRFLLEDESQTTLGRMRGTYAYTDPEIYDGNKFSEKADMYSMGIILWELMYRLLKGVYLRPYGEYPFISRDFQIIVQVARKNVRPTIPETCPPLLADVIRSLWTRVGKDRPNASELYQIIESIQQIYLQNKNVWDALLPAQQFGLSDSGRRDSADSSSASRGASNSSTDSFTTLSHSSGLNLSSTSGSGQTTMSTTSPLSKSTTLAIPSGSPMISPVTSPKNTPKSFGSTETSSSSKSLKSPSTHPHGQRATSIETYLRGERSLHDSQSANNSSSAHVSSSRTGSQPKMISPPPLPPPLPLHSTLAGRFYQRSDDKSPLDPSSQKSPRASGSYIGRGASIDQSPSQHRHKRSKSSADELLLLQASTDPALSTPFPDSGKKKSANAAPSDKDPSKKDKPTKVKHEKAKRKDKP